jgi:hypothetical protein
MQHKEWAKDKISSCRADLIFDFISRFDLNAVLTDDDFKKVTQEHLDGNRYAEAATVILKFGFLEAFDVQSIILKLIDIQKIEIAKSLADKDPKYQKFLIESLATNENCKIAAKFISNYKLSIDDYPSVKERLLKGAMRYYLGKFIYKRIQDEDYMPAWKIEDMFQGFKSLLGYFVEDLTHKSNMNIAKGIFLRNNLSEHDVRPEIYQLIDDHQYLEAEDDSANHVDKFGPLSSPVENYKSLPEHVEVQMVERDDQVEQLDELLGEKYIGVDSEWRPSLVRFHKTYPALL